MLRLLITSLILLATVVFAGFPHGGDLPHRPGSGSGQGIILDTPPFTPGYHNGDDLMCSDCHIMHASMRHDYGYDDEYSYPFSQDPPSNYLLKAPNALELCLNCHQDYVGIPDVIGEDINGGMLRSGGQFEEAGILSDKGHNIGPDPGYLCTRCHFGGEFSTATVECIDCHDPHGTGYYRNLQWASAPGAQPPIIAFVNPAANDLDKYQAANVRYGAPGDQPGQVTWREVTNICIDCHHSVGDASPNGGSYTNPDLDEHWNRHPHTNTEWGAYRPISGLPGDPYYSADSTNWFEGQGSEFSIGRMPFIVVEAHDFSAASVVAYDNEVLCLSCHSAHGSEFAFGMRWDPSVSNTPLQTAGCRQCHNNTTGNIN